MKILLFSRDPGGANVIIPLYRPLREKGHEVLLYGKDFALKKYREEGLEGVEFSQAVPETGEAPILDLLKTLHPDVIITGTSADDRTEKLLWKISGQLGIPSFAVLDQWLNYGIRFSDHSVSEYTSYEKDRAHPYLPARILVMDEFTKKEMIAVGFERERIAVTGQPYLEKIEQRSKKITPEEIRSLKERAGYAPTDFIVTYASEPISATYRETDASPHFWGYTERTVLTAVLETMSAIGPEKFRSMRLIIRPHPKESADNYRDILGHYGKTFRIGIDNSLPPHDQILVSDLVVGMSSLFLIESLLFGKPILSVQTGLNRENPFVPHRLGIMKSVTDRGELEMKLRRIFVEKKVPSVRFRLVRDPVRKIIKCVEAFLCRS